MVQWVSIMKIYQERIEDSLVGLMHKHKKPSMAIKIPGSIMCVFNHVRVRSGAGRSPELPGQPI